MGLDVLKGRQVGNTEHIIAESAVGGLQLKLTTHHRNKDGASGGRGCYPHVVPINGLKA